MNAPFVTGQANLWAKRLRGQASETEERIKVLYESAFARLPSDSELDASRAFLVEQSKLHNASEDSELPWRDLAHAIVNAKEFIFLN